MAANYWVSTQRLHWQFSRQKLAEIRARVEGDGSLAQQYPLPEYRLLNIYFRDQLTKLGRKLSMRQQAIATAQVYVRRFYTKVEVRNTNPYLVMATAIYLAGKMEECPQHIRLVVSEAHTFWPDLMTSNTAKLGECEFSLIAEMNSQLIVHHPYRDLTELQASLGLSQDESALAWSVVNDHYLTDLPLLYPPHVIAVMAIFLSVVLKPSPSSMQPAASAVGTITEAVQTALSPAESSSSILDIPEGEGAAGDSNNGNQTKCQRLAGWLAEGEVDVEALLDSVQEMISLFDIWEHYNDKVCKEQIVRFVKAQGLDK